MCRAVQSESLPAWGVWIEIPALSDQRAGGRPSLPAWGVWIEILLCQEKIPSYMSLPAWGVWIEIAGNGFGALASRSLPAWGVWIEISTGMASNSACVVAPRMGSVD